MLTTRLKQHNFAIFQSFYSLLLDGTHAVQISITVRAHRALLCVKRKVSVDPCWPSVYSAESCLISLGINAQRGTATVPAAVQQPENSTFYSLSLSLSLSIHPSCTPSSPSSVCWCQWCRLPHQCVTMVFFEVCYSSVAHSPARWRKML